MDYEVTSIRKLKCIFLITGMMMGGAERVLSTISNELVSRGHDVTLISLKPDDSAYQLDRRVEFVRSTCNITDKYRLVQQIKMISSAMKGIKIYMKTVIEKRPDIVLSFLTNTNLLALICQKAFFREIPLIISERCDPCIRTSKIQRKIIDWLYPKADCIVCQGDKVADYFKSVSKNAKTCIIPNPINAECICREDPQQRQKKIIAMGRLSKQKNYDLLIDSFFIFNQQNDEYVVEIYGQGPEERHLLEKIAFLGLEEKIHLMGTTENVMKKTYQASLYVMSSNFEGFPNALLEAMASGLPAICTDFPTGIAHDLIINGVNGYIVPLHDREKMISAIHSILDDSKTIDRMGNEAKKIYERFEVKAIVEQWEALFWQLALS